MLEKQRTAYKREMDGRERKEGGECGRDERRKRQMEIERERKADVQRRRDKNLFKINTLA